MFYNLGTMLTSKERNFIIVYFLLLICDLFMSSLGFQYFRCFSKPSILVALIIFFLFNRGKLSQSVFRLTTLALLFSLLGDVLLLFTEVSSHFFIGGLTSFLFAHIMYILVFYRKVDKQRRKTIFFLLGTLAYVIVLFSILYKGLSDMMVPVLVYMIVILIMSNLAYSREKDVSNLSYILVFIGALFFMVSDSILALDMFYKSIAYSNVWIMTTYATAQLLIIYGIIRQKEQADLEKNTL